MYFQDQLCVMDTIKLKRKISEEIHKSQYTIYHGEKQDVSRFDIVVLVH
jgi:hypothetical protein